MNINDQVATNMPGAQLRMLEQRSRHASILDIRVLPLLLACLALSALALLGAAPAGRSRDPSMLLEAKAAVRRALQYLAQKQEDNGSWRDSPAMTALVVTGMMGSGEEKFGPKSEVVGPALDYIRNCAQPDGGIYDKHYASYSTSICAMALVEAGLPEDKELIRKAQVFLLGAQADAGEGVQPGNVQYGGWGYAKDPSGEGMLRTDMSNTQFAVEAIRALQDVAEEDRAAAGTGQGTRTRTELAYQRAAAFLGRCQNLKATNDQPWAANDGGFVYRPGESKAGQTPDGGLRSYGAMTYAGLKSMIYARLRKGDQRVQAAYGWICAHWTVEENPGLGQQGLYYYYLVMARALNAYGAERIVEPDETAHDWRRELIGRLLTVQRADGSWINENGRWMESIPELTTAYACLAVEQASAGW